MRRIIAVDIDGTLTEEVCFTVEQCRDATPRPEAIKRVNELYDTDFVIIFTGRGIVLAEATLKWLTKHNVRYHACRFEKMPYDVIFDQDSFKI